MKLELSRQIFEKYSYIKFNENRFSGNRVVPFGRKDGQRDRGTDTTKLIVAFRNFANAPKSDRITCPAERAVSANTYVYIFSIVPKPTAQ